MQIAQINQQTLERLKTSSTQAVNVFHATQGGAVDIAAALNVAESIEDLRQLFNEESIKTRIQKLQDTPLGFRTDRDPKLTNRKTNQANTPYSYEIVKDACIEATLRGLQLVGNHFNIIAGRCYVTREGFEYLLKKVEGLTKFATIIGIPTITPKGGCMIECSAAWTLNGKPDDCKATIPILGNEYSTPDQFVGKATRKFLKRCYEQITGVSVPEGEEEHEERPRVEAPRPKIPGAIEVQTVSNDRFAELESLISAACATFDDFVTVASNFNVWKPYVDGAASVADMKPESVERVLSKRGFLSKALATAVAERKGGAV